ncbi:coiled-coil domain-containing protein 171-like isoform X1 [Amphiprion ocellaris]|uniref:Coiled-coil domain containing 171 n=1 Tax=Amphiprion ocellaris TaxID=80972 RepID=A0AAQ5YPS7_AMPOC|nr:coiled-coil domain-containing protein 171-like isoform X1 [Amphiprion ocellaris]
MQPEPAERSRQSGRSRAEQRGSEERRSGEEAARLKQKEKQTGGKKRGKEEEERGRGRKDEGDESRRLRWKINELEKEKLQLTTEHNQEICRLQAASTRLRSAVELSEAQGAELQYQLTTSRRENQSLAGRVSVLQETLDETRRRRQQDHDALQQEVEERNQLIDKMSSENQRLQRLLQEQQEVLQDLQQEKLKEAEVKQRQTDQMKLLKEKLEESRRENELSEQKIKTLEANMEEERSTHLETKFTSEIVQLRLRDLEAMVAVERSGQQEALCSLKLLRDQLMEERERRDATERALQRLQTEFDQCRSDVSVAMETQRKMASDLSEQLEDEKRRHADTQSLLQQAAQSRSEADEAFVDSMNQIRDLLKQHGSSGEPAEDAGSRSLSAEVLQLLRTTLSSNQHRLQEADQQVQDLLFASQKLQDDNQTLRQLASDHKSQIEESRLVSVRLEEEATRLRQEASDWSKQSQVLRVELDEERKARTEEVQEINGRHQEESTARLTFLHCLYQRLLAGCVLLQQPQSILGNFTWLELCDVISEQVDQLTSDLQKANDKIAHLQSVCHKKSVCVRELQRSQECVLSRLKESVKRREEAWNSQHLSTVKELQLCRSQCDSLQALVSSLTSDLTRSRRTCSSCSSASVLLGGALRHALLRLGRLSQQKSLLSRRLEELELLEEEVRRLGDALGAQEEEQEDGGRRSRPLRRWRRTVWVVMAVRRWRQLAANTTLLFQVETGGRTVCVCGGSATLEGQNLSDQDEGPAAVCYRLLRSERLSSIILSSMSDLQEALSHSGSAPPHLMSAARSALSRLLDQLLDQSADGMETDRLRPTPRPDVKALVSNLQQHFLLFSQRLHSAEVERRSLRVELANQKRGQRREEDSRRTAASERFHSVCAELREALSREQQAQTLIQEQSHQLHTLRQEVNAHNTQQTDTQRTLSRTTQEVSRKERSLRILGKHLSEVQRQKEQVEEKLQRAEEELSHAHRQQEAVISCVKAAERNCTQVRDSLVQSQRSMVAEPRPLLELRGAESIMGAAEVAACQSLLSSISQLCHTCSSRIGWLEQEVSAHRSHVTALLSELQDVCLRDNQAFVPVTEFPETIPLADVDKPPPVLLSDWPKDLEDRISPAPPEINPTPLSLLCKPKAKKVTKKKKVGGSR